jgi:hypothetical protein
MRAIITESQSSWRLDRSGYEALVEGRFDARDLSARLDGRRPFKNDNPETKFQISDILEPRSRS